MLYVDKNSILSKNNNPIVLEPPRLSREQQDGASPASTPGSAPSAAFRVPPRRICSLPSSMFAAYKSCPLAALPRLPLKHDGSHRALPGHPLPSCQNGGGGLRSGAVLRVPSRPLTPRDPVAPAPLPPPSRCAAPRHAASVTPDPRRPFRLTGSARTSLKIPRMQHTGTLNFATTPLSHALCPTPATAAPARNRGAPSPLAS